MTSYNLLQQTEHLSPKELKKTIEQAIDEKFFSLKLDTSRHEDIAILEDLRKAGIANAYNRRDVAMKRIVGSATECERKYLAHGHFASEIFP